MVQPSKHVKLQDCLNPLVAFSALGKNQPVLAFSRDSPFYRICCQEVAETCRFCRLLT